MQHHKFNQSYSIFVLRKNKGQLEKLHEVSKYAYIGDHNYFRLYLYKFEYLVIFILILNNLIGPFAIT